MYRQNTCICTCRDRIHACAHVAHPSTVKHAPRDVDSTAAELFYNNNNYILLPIHYKICVDSCQAVRTRAPQILPFISSSQTVLEHQTCTSSIICVYYTCTPIWTVISSRCNNDTMLCTYHYGAGSLTPTT